MIIAVKRAVKGVHEKVINYLKHKIARCSVLRLTRGFQWSFESASLAEAVGGRSKMIRAALLCRICSSAISVVLPRSPQIISL